MIRLIRAEMIKGRHSFARKGLVGLARGLAATLVLTCVCLWQVPLWMAVCTRFSSAAAFGSVEADCADHRGQPQWHTAGGSKPAMGSPVW